MEFKYLVIILLMLIAFSFIINNYLIPHIHAGGGADDDGAEHFMSGDGEGNVEDKVIAIYADLLQRRPTSQELEKESRDIVTAKLTLDGLRERLINTDEYNMTVKMQSNSLSPELPKMLSDRSVLNRMNDIYTEETKKKVPPQMILPMKDLYIYFGYSEGSVRALLRDPQYPAFESDVVTTQNLNNKALIDMFNKAFDLKKIQATGVEINRQIPEINDLSIDYGTAEALGVTLASTVPRTVNDTDTNSAGSLNKMNNNPALFNKDAAAAGLTLYDSNGNPIVLAPIITVTDKKGNPVGTIYDSTGKVVPQSAVVSGMTGYDQDGKPFTVVGDGTVDQKGNPIGTLYDANGVVIPAMALTSTSTVYDASGNLMTVVVSPNTDVDSLGNPAGTLYDAHGNIIPASSVTSGMTVYDADGNPLTTSANINGLTDATQAAPNQPPACAALRYKQVMLPTHQGDMVLRPELAWSVPNYRPPVCTTLGQAPLVQPVFSSTNSSLLLGTPLADANNTRVGSIMPKFTYKEYIDIPN